MADITQIAASIAALGASTQQQAQDLPLGQTIEAKITQILSDGLIRLSAYFGTFELKASHPSLQPGVSVRLDVSESGTITLTVLPQKTAGQPQPQTGTQQPTAPQSAQLQPAVITTLSSGQAAQAPPMTYSATGQTVQQGQAPVAVIPATPPQANLVDPALNIISQVVAAAPAEHSEVMPQAASTQRATSPPTMQAPGSLPVQSAETPAATSVMPSLSAALSEALARQSSLAPLVANLNSLSKQAKPLPPSLQAAIEEVLQTVQPLAEETTPQNLEQAIKRSGVFFENALVHRPPQVTNTVSPFPDLKSALLKLVDVLSTFKSEQAVQQKQIFHELPPPAAPRGHEPPETQKQHPATLTYATQQEITEVLSKQAEGALSRVRVLQFASMPVALTGTQETQRPAQIWHLDIPLLINGQGSVIPLQIERDAEKKEAAAAAVQRWRVRFALDLGELGPVHALLVLGSGLVDVTLWAERNETYDMFKASARELHYALMNEDLEVAEIEFRTGSPRKAAARAGSNLDTHT